MAEAIVRRVDHLVVRVHSPEPMFKLLTQQLLLPTAWPLTTNPFYTSGGIHLGNLNLEIMQVGQQARPARPYGIAFELEPYDMSLPELRARNIPHTPPMPFFIVDEQGWQITAWNNVYLGGLMGDSRAAKLFFSFSQHAPKETWEQSTFPKPFNRRFGLPFVFDTVYRNGMVFAVEYNRAWRTLNIKEELAHTGLDVQRVYEITIGVQEYERAYDCWKALLEPLPEISKGIWELPDGMHLRLAKRPANGIRRMIWQVSSLNRAAQFLHKREMLGKERSGMISIAPEKIMGLDIRLVQ
ncbi:MAG: hypothetical protein EHM21_11480 [Chloroflexi bacterium]|nr:MAG: hypothetical protein EHM21_11480 [Chloroflexota bacterium]